MSGCESASGLGQVGATAAVLGPALIVTRAQQLVVEGHMVAFAVMAVMGHSLPSAKTQAAAVAHAIHLAVSCGYLLVGLASLALTCTLLANTASPRARRRSCCGPSQRCLSYHCDFGWDVTAAIVWTCLLVCLILFDPFPLVMLVVNILLIGLFLTSAVLSGLVRKRLRQRGVTNDIEVATAGQQRGREVYQKSTQVHVTHQPL